MKHISKALRMTRTKGSHYFICQPHVYARMKKSLYSVCIHQMAPPMTGVADIGLQLTTISYNFK